MGTPATDDMSLDARGAAVSFVSALSVI